MKKSFSEIPLSVTIQKTLSEMGFEYPTDIQAQTIPVALLNRDVMSAGRSGSGKISAFCIPIIAKLENAHNILIFGPSVSKFELQKEIINVKHLKQARRQLMTTDLMEKESALRFVKHHYTPIIVGQEIFVVASKN